MSTIKIQKIIFIISGILLIGGAILFLFNQNLAVIGFGLGTIGSLYVRIKNLTKSSDFRIKRLQKIQALSAILLLGTVYLMYIKSDAWIIALILSAIIDLIISYRMPNEE